MLFAWAAHSGNIGIAPVLLYLSGIAWTLFYDTIYAHQDVEDDALIGVKSTARLFGDNSKVWLRNFLIAAVSLMGLAVIAALTQGASPLALVVGLAGAWAFGWHMTWQLKTLDIEDAENCKRVFRSNRDAGLIVVLAFAGAIFL